MNLVATKMVIKNIVIKTLGNKTEIDIELILRNNKNIKVGYVCFSSSSYTNHNKFKITKDIETWLSIITQEIESELLKNYVSFDTSK